MEIKSSLINSDEFEFVKNSLIKVSEKDHEEDFRVKALEYINDTSDEKDDKFFYDMLEFVRFLDPDDDATAYTTPEHLIYLNCPSGGNNPIGKSVRKWDFIFDHECLHQLWDTFGVAEKIKEEQGEDKYNHKLLNFASDCVINDYLYYYRKKERPDNLITPEYIKEQFKVEYDRKVDTQYTLYLKMLPELEKIQKDQKYQDQPDEDEEQDQGQNSGQGSDSKSGKGNSSGNEQQKKENKTADDAQKSADEAKKSAKKAQDAADKATEAGDKDAEEKQKKADEAKKAVKEAQNAADKAAEAKDKGDKKTEEKAAKEAQDAADKAKKLADEANGEKNDGEGKGQGDGTANHEETEADLKDIQERAKEIIENYKNKLSGDFGTFISKCKKSVELKKSGLSTGVNKGMSGWNQQLNTSCNAFVKKKVFQKKREYKSTYSRTKRGSGFVEYGKPIKPGRKIRENKLTINVAFYIDISGSMGSCIKDVWKASYAIAEGLKKKFKSESVVDEVTFKMHAFDTQMFEVPYGKEKNAGGGTMNFEKILEYIKDNTYDYLINIIITDAGFSIDKQQTAKFIKNINGMIEFVTNVDSAEMKNLAKQYPTQLNYILADPQFNIQ